jgi:hypothetical protein
MGERTVDCPLLTYNYCARRMGWINPLQLLRTPPAQRII